MQQRRDNEGPEIGNRLVRRPAAAGPGGEEHQGRQSRPASAAPPPAARVPATRRRQTLSQQLRRPGALGNAFLLVEILGPPRALRPWREPADQL